VRVFQLGPEASISQDALTGVASIPLATAAFTPQVR
jgi:hypothetical protein